MPLESIEDLRLVGIGSRSIGPVATRRAHSIPLLLPVLGKSRNRASAFARLRRSGRNRTAVHRKHSWLLGSELQMESFEDPAANACVPNLSMHPMGAVGKVGSNLDPITPDYHTKWWC